ncbi:TPA: membrane integrity-associated transporter subunit PqiC [Pseudomonas aeruginosa]|uniref:ABC-type transport auxiliary lipoprotein family protein n=1 Tax=Pseudomonas aeruginosa TaxID=287 RepID=UPI0006770032|nr:ABC-type transport auxiliary lipoprotein family protein [Pseudomonas aeruginosa]MBH4028541.1 membrane integrity-associated transporter subunit PqiC [Pseudomonas aeruginosa]MBV5530489.1 membrane integrity-associated transporter subunit PqiC [Pseudomonas aeruginosa]MCS8095467.1 ABC-type transport auxiliary lipoprotein family protein [Pseudomonas aeruginosa]HBO2879735.1 membrane integrity-associated transporter subunit PqiC [Pseudomonas aeruginosa]HEJ3161517.1 membrane integrity-associated tra
MAAAISLLAVLLGACTTLPSPPPSASLYDFGLPAADAHAPDVQAGSSRVLMLAGVTAAGLPVGHQDLLYRYAYSDDHHLRAYQRARWSLPAEQLLAQRLRQQLQSGWAVLTPEVGRIRPSPELSEPLVLHVNLERFEQVFTEAERSVGVIQLQATVHKASDGSLVTQRVFQRSVPAPSAAARLACADLDQWLQSLGQ